MREPMVLVEWEDSDSTQGWHHLEDVATTAPCVSLGFLVRDEEGLVVISQSLNEHEDGPFHRTARLGNSLTIPRSAVRRIVTFRQPDES